jgi:hypothetical protein
MVRRAIWCVMAVAIVMPALCFAGPMVFSVRPSATVQSANFGFERGKLTPYVGLDFLAMGVDVKYTERDEWSGGSWEEDTVDMSGSAILVIPTFGVRYALAGEELKPYLFGSLLKSFAFVSAEGKEVHRWGGPGGSGQDIDEYDLGDEEEELVEEILGVWGLDFGFGAEYPFSEHFSVAGQYGLRIIFLGGDYEDSDSSGSGSSQWREEWKEELSGTLGLSHAEVALWFTFD